MGVVPHLTKLFTKYDKKGFTIIANSYEDKNLLMRFIVHNTPLPYKVFVKSHASGYGHKVIPYSYLIGADGKILWEGNPNALDTKKIDEALQKRTKLFQEEFKGASSQAISKAIYGDFGAAYCRLVSDKSKINDEAAQKLLKYLEEIGNNKQAYADKLFNEKEYLEAYILYYKIKQDWRDTEYSKHANEKIKEYTSNNDVKKEYSALRDLDRLESLYLNGKKSKKNMEEGAQRLRMFAKNKNIDGTKASEKAIAMAEIFENPWK